MSNEQEKIRTGAKRGDKARRRAEPAPAESAAPVGPGLEVEVLRQLEQSVTELQKRTLSLASAHAGLSSGGTLGTPIHVQGKDHGEATPAEAERAFYEALARVRRGYFVANHQSTTDASKDLEQSVLLAAHAALEDAHTVESRIFKGVAGSGVELGGVIGMSTQKQRNAAGGRFAAVDNQAVAACHVDEPGEVCGYTDDQRSELRGHVEVAIDGVAVAWQKAIADEKINSRLRKDFLNELAMAIFFTAMGGVAGVLVRAAITGPASAVSASAAKAGAEVASKPTASLSGLMVEAALVKGTEAGTRQTLASNAGVGNRGGERGEVLQDLSQAVSNWQQGAKQDTQFLDDQQLMLVRERLQPFTNDAYWRAELRKLVARHADEVETIHAHKGIVSGSQVGVIWLQAQDGRRRLAKVQWAHKVSYDLTSKKEEDGAPRFVDWISEDMVPAAVARQTSVHGNVVVVPSWTFEGPRVQAWASEGEAP